MKVKEYIKKHWLGLVVSIAIPLIAGFLSSVLAGNSSEIYKSLVLPPVSPPGWLFPVAWIILYVCMGVASYMIYTSKASKKQKVFSLSIYAVQLALNFSWSIVFFRYRAFGAAVVIILLLTLVVTFMMADFYRNSKSAGLIILDYVIWLLFAAYLCIGVFILN